MDDKILMEMMTERPANRDRGRTRRFLLTAGIFGLGIAGAVTLTTGALFTDNDESASNDFTTGTVDITSTPKTAVVASPNMAPGDVVYGNVTVTNSGSLEHRYAVTDWATDTAPADLSTQLKLDIFSVPGGWCDAAGVAMAGTKLLGSKGPIATAEEKLFGDAAQGGDTGDRVLAAGAEEKLCVRITLPLETSNEYQSTHSDITLKFYAEQTANNA